MVMGGAVTNLRSLTPRTPVAAVDPNDLKRVWHLFLDTDRVRPAGAAASTIGISAKLIAQQCSPGADVLAVSFRTALLQGLLREGMLDDWRDGNELRDTVFDAAATFPLQNGIESFNPNAFIE